MPTLPVLPRPCQEISRSSRPTRRKFCVTLFRGGHAMKNVEMSVLGNILTITVDLSKEFGPSSSGKTIIIASTEGNVAVPNREEKVGLNVYRKKWEEDIE